MPELPEVETMRRGLLRIEGSVVEDVQKIRCVLKPILIRPRVDVLRRRVQGRRVLRVDRIGKRVVVRFENEDGLIFEPRMTGLVLVADPPNVDHLRFHLRLSGGPVADVWYWDRRGLGSVQLLAKDAIDDRLGAKHLGPDALTLSLEQLHQQLAHRRTAVKIALLNQRAVAGIGNLYASEILHAATIHPQKHCTRLTRREWPNLHRAILQVLADAVRYEGSTLGDGTYRNALNNPGSYQNHHRVYSRAGELCPTCERSAIRRIVQVQRATFYCPHCQRK